VMLVSTPGLIQKATRSTLASCVDVELVAVASGALSATNVLAKLEPDVILVDANLPEGEMEALLCWTKDHLPGVICVVATASSEQSGRALLCGAHTTIHRSGLAEQLSATLSRLGAQT
jgi:DNA-binding NarL/FixJ family response regulator